MGLAPHLTVPVEEVLNAMKPVYCGISIASIVQLKDVDPDVLTSWDTHGAGIGYLVERGMALGKARSNRDDEMAGVAIDLVRLLGRTSYAKHQITGLCCCSCFVSRGSFFKWQ